MPIATQIYKSIERKVPTLIINFNPPQTKNERKEKPPRK